MAHVWSATITAAAVVERNVYEKASMSIAVSGETDAEADTFLKDKLCEQGLRGARHDPKSPRLGGHPFEPNPERLIAPSPSSPRIPPRSPTTFQLTRDSISNTDAVIEVYAKWGGRCEPLCPC